MSPQRIQRKRTKGWTMPEGAVYVGRGTGWGNPFKVGALFADRTGWHRRPQPLDSGLAEAGRFQHVSPMTRDDYTEVVALVRDRAHAVELFVAYVAYEDDGWWSQRNIGRRLAGRDLACWCPLDGQPCHADVLLALANGEAQ